MSEYFGVKVEDIFNTMEERFRPEGAEGVSASFGYNIKDVGMWRLDVGDGKMNLEKRDALDDCDVVMHADADTLRILRLLFRRKKVPEPEAVLAGECANYLASTCRQFLPPYFECRGFLED